MSKRVLLLVVVAGALTGSLWASLLTPQQKAVIQRRRAVSRELIEDGTNKYWVVHYMKGAADAGTFTNAVHDITGAVQYNPIQVAYNEKAAVVAKIRARAVTKSAYYWDLYDKAKLATTKALYKALAELNDIIIKQCDGEDVPDL